MKKLIYLLIIIALLLFIALWTVSFQTNDEPLPSSIIEILDSNSAKLEYFRSDKPIFITSEIRSISQTFGSLDLVQSEVAVGTWIYKITFNPSEIVIGGNEIVVLVGSKSMSINDMIYSTPPEVPFDKVVDIFQSKYEYFCHAQESA